MAEFVKYVYGTEAQILSLLPDNPNWIEKAFYYPSDKTYFYQLVNGTMKKYGAGTSVETGSGIGITLNGAVIGGVKSLIEEEDILDIPEYYEYNIYDLDVDGIINCDGVINTI